MRSHRDASGRNTLKPTMYGPKKSDSPIVPLKRPNEAGRPGEEAVEGRGLPKGTAVADARHRTPSRIPA